MGRKKPKYTPEPRLLSQFQVATLLGCSEDTLRSRLDVLEKSGFPRYDDLLRGWDGHAINLWMDSRSGINVVTQEIPNASFDRNALTEAINGRTS